MARQQVGDLDVVRQEILASALGTSGAQLAVMFELNDGGSHYRAESFSDARTAIDCQLPSNSLLIKWLRANGDVLAIPDPVGVFQELPEHDRTALQAAGLSACLPLAHDRAPAG